MTWVRSVRNIAWLAARVDVNPATGCWEWRLARNHLGYGYYGDNAGAKHKTSKAHRLAFDLANGYLPATVLHRCDNPPCCNPAHLRDGTQSDNVQDMLAKGRSTVAVLSWQQAAEIRMALAHGATGRQLARFYGVHEGTISKIKLGRCWVRPEDRKIGPMPERLCPACQQTLPSTKNAKTIYCSSRCSGAAYRRRHGQKPRRKGRRSKAKVE